MTDSGNSGAGTRTPLASCKRCGHAPDRCLIYLTEAIVDWAGVGHDEAARLAGKVWEETRSAREGESPTDVEQPARECTFCGGPARRLPSGRVVVTRISPGVNPVEDPICEESPTERHALP